MYHGSVMDEKQLFFQRKFLNTNEIFNMCVMDVIMHEYLRII